VTNHRILAPLAFLLKSRSLRQFANEASLGQLRSGAAGEWSGSTNSQPKIKGKDSCI
jgi:hypothetical protein